MEPSPGRRDAGVGLLWGVSDTVLLRLWVTLTCLWLYLG